MVNLIFQENIHKIGGGEMFDKKKFTLSMVEHPVFYKVRSEKNTI